MPVPDTSTHVPTKYCLVSGVGISWIKEQACELPVDVGWRTKEGDTAGLRYYGNWVQDNLTISSKRFIR